MNPGGPGGSAVDFAQGNADLFAAFNDHFDIVAFDPRGTGASSPAIDCKVNQETQGIYAAPFTTPENLDVRALPRQGQVLVKRCVELNKEILPHASTANAARDMDAIRALMGDKKLNYFGFSYGTFLGATYTSLFPDNYRAMVLDGPLDAKGYINDRGGSARAVGRVRARARPLLPGLRRVPVLLPVRRRRSVGGLRRARGAGQRAADPGPRLHRRPASGQRRRHPQRHADHALQQGQLAAPRAGSHRGRRGRRHAPALPGRRRLGQQLRRHVRPGHRSLLHDRRHRAAVPDDLRPYLETGDNSWGMFEHFWLNSGYVELHYGLWPIHDKDAYDGPFTASKSAPTVLEVATTYDPATPLRGAKRLATQLGNVRFLTMVGDGHTAFRGTRPASTATSSPTSRRSHSRPRARSACRTSRSCRRRRGRDREAARCSTDARRHRRRAR